MCYAPKWALEFRVWRTTSRQVVGNSTDLFSTVVPLSARRVVVAGRQAWRDAVPSECIAMLPLYRGSHSLAASPPLIRCSHHKRDPLTTKDVTASTSRCHLRMQEGLILPQRAEIVEERCPPPTVIFLPRVGAPAYAANVYLARRHAKLPHWFPNPLLPCAGLAASLPGKVTNEESTMSCRQFLSSSGCPYGSRCCTRKTRAEPWALPSVYFSCRVPLQ